MSFISGKYMHYWYSYKRGRNGYWVSKYPPKFGVTDVVQHSTFDKAFIYAAEMNRQLEIKLKRPRRFENRKQTEFLMEPDYAP